MKPAEDERKLQTNDITVSTEKSGPFLLQKNWYIDMSPSCRNTLILYALELILLIREFKASISLKQWFFVIRKSDTIIPTEGIGDSMNNIVEIREAIDAGERALRSLYSAQDKLKGARGWGIFDMLGGGFISDLIKHSKMEEAKYHLQRFRKELSDVNGNFNLQLNVGGFLSFADFFFDGFVADYLVQSKISEARRQVDDAIAKVSRILEDLKRAL